MIDKAMTLKVSAFIRGEFKTAEVIVPVVGTETPEMQKLIEILFSLVDGKSKVTAVQLTPLGK